ncbi:serine protease [Pseudonocardiaceae bacterium YIM PH 21723]|nr:serine protease [Pseudonocardiaceae bacterium YIM PH 21723]
MALFAGTGVISVTPTAGPKPIVGGEVADIKQTPWLGYYSDTNGKFTGCGVSLVTPTKAITAAHCVRASSVTFGRQKGLTGSGGTTVKIAKSWKHPKYSAPGSGTGYDFAVLTLETPVTGYAPVTVVEKSDTGLYPEGTPATVYGWGHQKSGGTNSDDLRKVTVPIISDANCAKSYTSGLHPATEVCAGLAEGGKDSCQNDSGGPLIVGGKLIGVVSWGKGCAGANAPGVYGELISALDDIKAQL